MRLDCALSRAGLLLPMSLLCLSGASAQEPASALEEIVVTATLREAPAASVPISVTVLDDEVLQDAAVQHFDEIALRVPNLNLAGEGARPRYFQLRGIGELEQYEGAPNPSLGFVVDDIDFSALGSMATLFGLESIEILRGPQGTRYGANALGGLIYARSTPPPESYGARFESTVAGNGTWGIGAAAGGPVGARAGWQGSVQQFQSDGFRNNRYLGRDDTDGLDELTARLKLRAEPAAATAIEVNAVYVDLADGYDAWTIDNDRSTETDRPGRDRQSSVGASLRIEHAFRGFDLVGISSWAESDVDLGFDADWGNPELWSPYVYDFFSQTLRERRSLSQEIRLVSQGTDGVGWVVGAYGLALDETNDRRDSGRDDDPSFGGFELDATNVSDYEARHAAVFGQIEIEVGERVDLQAGLRFERRDAEYADSIGNRFDPVDDMVGGELAAIVHLDEKLRLFARLARGYRAGGFNLGFAGVDFTEADGLTPADIEFDPEYLWNLEVGLKGHWLERRIMAEISVFVARRDGQQIKVPLQLRAGDPSSFMFVTANAERGADAGLEAQVEWQATDRLRLTGAAGLLHTEIERFELLPDLEGRAQAHAPDYSLTTTARYEWARGWWTRLDVVARDGFYYDYSHNERAGSYVVPTLRIGRDWSTWGVALWARNFTDADYTTRGFFFGNEPPDFENRLYTRLGDPRQIGLTLRYSM
jgi:iron complex outermembrane receptor protein